MKTTKLARLALFVLLAAGIALTVAYRDRFDVHALGDWLHDAGPAAPLVFMLIYAVGTVLFLPGSVLTLAGGALFGPVLGTFYNLTGATIGATLAFLMARYMASDWVTRKAGGRLKLIMDGVDQEGWRFMAFVRLVPLFPFNLLNFALGLTRIRLSHYIVASYICMLPGAIAYTYLGYAGREAMAGGEGLIQKGMLALGLLALVAFLPRLISRLRQGKMLSVAELEQRLKGADAPLVLDVRGTGEFTGELGHIDGARNIPLDKFKQRIGELDDYRERPLAIVCHTDKRSAKAAQLLGRQGFADVHVVRGGMSAWNREGLPVVR
jgi:uncharacterized membrane protein YdjX (TVP38/TMEM64 family)/rhodanese-related sulfurtransferase